MDETSDALGIDEIIAEASRIVHRAQGELISTVSVAQNIVKEERGNGETHDPDGDDGHLTDSEFVRLCEHLERDFAAVIAEERLDRRHTDDPLKRYLLEIAALPRITVEEERALGLQVRLGDLNAVEKLVTANLRFVVSFAKRYRGLGVAFLDLISEGNLGLIEAAKRFDPDKNVKFVTYAVWWIRQSIIHALSDQSGPFRLPQKQANLLYRIGKTQAALRTELERRPSVEEIAEAMSADTADVALLLQVSDENISLSDVIDEEHEFHLSDKISDDSFEPPDQTQIRNSLCRDVRISLGFLDEKERRVIELRFGFSGKDPMTLKEIGEIMNLSRERIRQIEAQVLKKLHRIRGLREYST